MDATLRAALEIARWAPSAHNTQPWRVEQRGKELIVSADEGRWLHHGDPARRDLDLSVGCFAEALRLGLLAQGEHYELSVASREDESSEKPGGAALVRRGEGPRDSAGASLLRQRQTSRLAYSPRGIDVAKLKSLESAAKEAGLWLHLVRSPSSEHANWRQWLFLASRESWLDSRAVAELAQWIRIDPEGARRPEDGLSTHCLGLGPAETAGLATVLRPRLWRALSALYLAPILAEQLASAEAAQAEGTPLLGVLIIEPAAEPVGARLLRWWLEATRSQLVLHPLSVLLDRRGWELAKSLGVAPRELALVFRLGHSTPPPRSHRRPADAFLHA
jgi:nitroreductase